MSFECKTLITCELVATAGATPSPDVSVRLDKAFVQTLIPFTALFSLETYCLSPRAGCCFIQVVAGRSLKQERNAVLHKDRRSLFCPTFI